VNRRVILIDLVLVVPRGNATAKPVGHRRIEPPTANDDLMCQPAPTNYSVHGDAPLADPYA
jgi:hypothetical protein